jgi:hypothetical protein
MSELQPKFICHLPSGYDDNKIVLLARDPHWLYAYWEISEAKKNSFKNEFGEGLWDRSVPVIKIINVSKNTSTTIRVNDFSDSWFINVDDSNALYVAELGRVVANQFFINLACSNYISTPSNSISSNTGAYFIDYKDLRNGRLDLESGQIYETYEIQTNSITRLGISSAELFKRNLNQHLGISSFRSDK